MLPKETAIPNDECFSWKLKFLLKTCIHFGLLKVIFGQIIDTGFLLHNQKETAISELSWPAEQSIS